MFHQIVHYKLSKALYYSDYAVDASCTKDLEEKISLKKYSVIQANLIYRLKLEWQRNRKKNKREKSCNIQLCLSL